MWEKDVTEIILKDGVLPMEDHHRSKKVFLMLGAYWYKMSCPFCVVVL